MKGTIIYTKTLHITPSSSGYILVPLSNEGVAVRGGVACSMVVDPLLEVGVAGSMIVDPLLEVGVAVGNGVSCFAVVRVGDGITSVIWVTVYR